MADIDASDQQVLEATRRGLARAISAPIFVAPLIGATKEVIWPTGPCPYPCDGPAYVFLGMTFFVLPVWVIVYALISRAVGKTFGMWAMGLRFTSRRPFKGSVVRETSRPPNELIVVGGALVLVGFLSLLGQSPGMVLFVLPLGMAGVLPLILGILGRINQRMPAR